MTATTHLSVSENGYKYDFLIYIFEKLSTYIFINLIFNISSYLFFTSLFYTIHSSFQKELKDLLIILLII